MTEFLKGGEVRWPDVMPHQKTTSTEYAIEGTGERGGDLRLRPYYIYILGDQPCASGRFLI